MKALTYNPEKEIMTALAVLFFSIVMMAKVHGQGPLSHLAMYPDTFESDSEDSFMSTSSDAEYTESEPTNEIQGWMLSNTYWGNPVSAEEIESESGLQIERWMSSNNYWGVNNFGSSAEADTPLQIERWMNSDRYFGFEVQYTETDKEQKIEQWMNSAAYWTGEAQNQFPENLAEK